MNVKFYRNLLILMFVANSIDGQSIRGRLLDAKTREPIVGANVYIANTSVGTVSNEKGTFEIKKTPQNTLELVVAMIGYEAFVMPLSLDTLRNRSLTILLREKVEEIEAITVKAKGSNWRTNYEIFKKHFLGETENSFRCTIKNPEVLNFNYKGRLFKASADKELIVENRRLGYVLKYKLVDFSVDFRDNYFLISGYPFFEPMKGSVKQQKKWNKARKEAYQGSSMHLIRSLYHKNWEQEGFQLKKLVRVPNPQRPSDTTIRRKIGYFTENPQKDSLEYWTAKAKLPKTIQVLHDKPLKVADSLVTEYRENPKLKKIDAKDCLQVVYTKGKVSGLYPLPAKEQLSVMIFNKPFLLLQEDGYIIGALDVTYEGYMPWKKMADLLPLDYQIED
jgi:hypothetical protein